MHRFLEALERRDMLTARVLTCERTISFALLPASNRNRRGFFRYADNCDLRGYLDDRGLQRRRQGRLLRLRHANQ